MDIETESVAEQKTSFKNVIFIMIGLVVFGTGAFYFIADSAYVSECEGRVLAKLGSPDGYQRIKIEYDEAFPERVNSSFYILSNVTDKQGNVTGFSAVCKESGTLSWLKKLNSPVRN